MVYIAWPAARLYCKYYYCHGRCRRRIDSPDLISADKVLAFTISAIDGFNAPDQKNGVNQPLNSTWFSKGCLIGQAATQNWDLGVGALFPVENGSGLVKVPVKSTI